MAAGRSLVTLGLVRGVEPPQLRAVGGVQREKVAAACLRGLREEEDTVAHGGLDREPEVLTLGDPELACDDLLLPEPSPVSASSANASRSVTP